MNSRNVHEKVVLHCAREGCCNFILVLKHVIYERGRGKYCSEPCRTAGRQDGFTQVKCQQAGCENVRLVSDNLLKAGRGKFCSRACYGAFVKSQPRIKTPKSEPMTSMVCKTCFTRFSFARKRLKQGRKFCSQSCASAYPKRKKPTVTLVEVNCKNCSNPFQAVKTQANRGRGMHCSPDCSKASRRRRALNMMRVDNKWLPSAQAV